VIGLILILRTAYNAFFGFSGQEGSQKGKKLQKEQKGPFFAPFVIFCPFGFLIFG
jgi:hypothetical protein